LDKQFRDSISKKITRAKWTGGVAYAVECLLSKHEGKFPLIKKKKKKTCSEWAKTWGE
jgi:hypothetical protein